MSKAELDEFARSYRSLHSSNIAITGEGPEYFAGYKMRDFAALARMSGAPKEGTYLDFGSGIGASVKPFRALFPKAELLCADVSIDSLAESELANGQGPKYILVQNGRIPVSDASIDGAFACCVLHHVAPVDHVPVLHEILRTLRPGAPLMIYEHNPLNPLTVRAVRTCPLDANAVLIGAYEMARRCRAAGFRSVAIDFRVFFPAVLGFLRPLEDHMRWLPLGAQYFVHCLR